MNTAGIRENTMRVDPICGMDVEEEATAPKSVYKGRTYFFCCQGCKEQFDSNPEKYARKQQ